MIMKRKGGSITVRTSRGAAVSVVPELVDVEGPLSVSVVALDVPRHAGGRGFGLLLEGHGTSDLGVTAEDSHWFLSVR